MVVEKFIHKINVDVRVNVENERKRENFLIDNLENSFHFFPALISKQKYFTIFTVQSVIIETLLNINVKVRNRKF